MSTMNEETRRVLHSSKKTDWGTPFELYHELDEIFNFTLDPCTTPDNPLGTQFFYTPVEDGLTKIWRGHNVFMNPPYGRGVGIWIQKAARSFYGTENVGVCLLPSRTGTKWFQHGMKTASVLVLMNKRVKFREAQHSAPFDSVLMIFGTVYDRELEELKKFGLVIDRRKPCASPGRFPG